MTKEPLMKSPCEQSFMCHRDQACPDTLCPEHPLSLQMLRRPGFLHDGNGGHKVSNEISVRVPAPTEAATKQSDAIGRAVLWAAGAVAFVLTGAAVFGVQLPF